MRIVRFTPKETAGLGNDPLFGVLNDKDELLVLKGDPIYQGIVPTQSTVNLAEVKVLAPVLPRSKVVAIGKNYADHAAEMNSAVPDEPIIFLKPNTSVAGPGDTITWPAMAQSVDYEGELAIVISRICKDVPKERYADVIFGYTIANDVTSRDLQKKDGQWTRAKGFDTFLSPRSLHRCFRSAPLRARLCKLDCGREDPGGLRAKPLASERGP